MKTRFHMVILDGLGQFPTRNVHYQPFVVPRSVGIWEVGS
jgi:hypothetical protein